MSEDWWDRWGDAVHSDDPRESPLYYDHRLRNSVHTGEENSPGQNSMFPRDPSRTFEQAIDAADFGFANLEGHDFSGAQLARFRFCFANLHRANLRGADLRGADLVGASLHSADLRQADLSEADLTCAVLTGADLSGANLTRAKLHDTYLFVTNLSEADLTDADLKPLSSTMLTSANFSGATMPDGSVHD